MSSAVDLRVGKRRLTVSHLDKVLFPAVKFTKAQLIDFYARIAGYVLPHLRKRPVTLRRYPDGIHGESLWEKDAPAFAPLWIKTFPVPRKMEPGVINYIVINHVETLAWCASVATIEFHPFLHTVRDIGRPTHIAFDLDPGEGADVLTCAEVALYVKELLEKLKLDCFAKVSGSTGIQLAVPLNTPVTYEATNRFSQAIAELLAQQHPDLVVTEMSKAVRSGKVFIDWSQNIDTKTTVGVYSLRAKRHRPYVSMPVRWEELKSALNKGDSDALYFDSEEALTRLAKVGDLFAPLLKRKQALPEAFNSRLSLSEPRSKRIRASKSLEVYRAKRNFNRTPEPSATPRRSMQGGKRRFVIQKHAASHLHYDFRLEIGGALKSWAVPKGLPYALDQSHTAINGEDHPLDYMQFEGKIPKGQYGGGTVMVWDIGTYEVIDGNYWKGRLHLYLSGKKVRGEWVLERRSADDAKSTWALIKVGTGMKSLSQRRDDSSALTGRSMKEIGEANGPVWQSDRANVPDQAASAPPKTPQPRMSGTKPAKFVSPTLATKTDKLPKGDRWIYEWKWDGYRVIAVKQADRITLFSRKGKLLNSAFPEIVDAIASIKAGSAIIDGEIVALNTKGLVSFQHLQNRATLPIGWHIVLVSFDLLNLDGRDLRREPLKRRRALLKTAVAATAVLFSTELVGRPAELIRRAEKQKYEGIVAKDRTSVYESGARSRAWLKLQTKPKQEFVIGGFRPGHGNLQLLLVGYYEGGQLLFAGKVRIGLNARNRETLSRLLKPQEKCPFANLPNSRRDHFGESVTADEMDEYVWVQPKVVVDVEFTEWTSGGVLRHAGFVGIREDKEPREVVKEAPTKKPEAKRKRGARRSKQRSSH